MNTPVLAYYGDDFTGSADVMEVLQWSGLRTVMFLEPPTPEELAAFQDLRAFGIAGWSRAMTPSEMTDALVPAFGRLKESGARFVHYKTCSTFDSSVEIGNIGRAIQLGRSAFNHEMVPVVVGAPDLGRYQVFGNLFARSGLDSEPFRLDRHPTMQHHPITPMSEADMGEHLRRLAPLSVGLVDLLELQARETQEIVNTHAADVLLFDVLTNHDLTAIGRCLCRLADKETSTFVVGSSGIESALTQAWQADGKIDAFRSHDPGLPTFSATDQLLIVTGSCSPVTDRQTKWALENGFSGVALETSRLVVESHAEHTASSAVERTIGELKKGNNVIVHSSRGPSDPRVEETRKAFAELGFDDRDIRLKSGRTLGPWLGRILKGVLETYPLERVAVAGGDTSGFVARSLGLQALEAIAPVAPGSPLCRVHAAGPMNGMEVFFKGGQVGKDDIWQTILRGTSSKS